MLGPSRSGSQLSRSLSTYPEAQLQEAVRYLCELNRVILIHHWSEKHSEPGWPDCTFIVDTPRPYVFYAELKTEKGKLTPDQEYVIATLRAAGNEVYVWRPHDWPEIIKKLGEIGTINARTWQSRIDRRRTHRVVRKARRPVR